MRRPPRIAALLGALACWVPCAPAAEAPPPRIGYVYPAGGQVGRTFRVFVGGQAITSSFGVVVSGGGVTAKVLTRSQALPNFDGPQRMLLEHLVACRRAAMAGEPEPAKPKRLLDVDYEVELPKHPLVEAIGEMSGEEIDEARRLLLEMRVKLLGNASLGNLLMLEVAIAPDAEPGYREMRMRTRTGLTNPVVFHVGRHPEFDFPKLPDGIAESGGRAPVATLPATLNGRILPGETRRIPLQLRQGTHVVARLDARRLIPYLADAVPGWFQAVMTLRDPDGREIGYADDFLFRPDPVLHGRIERDGLHILEVRDSILRGREDFIYRIEVGEVPLALGIFPLGCREGTTAPATLTGVNLPESQVVLDGRGEGGALREVPVPGGCGRTLPYAVGAPPEQVVPSGAEFVEVTTPVTLNGRLAAPGARVECRFQAKTGDPLVVDVMARRLGSPLDAVIEVYAPNGLKFAECDDVVERDGHLFLGEGLLTHHADPTYAFRATQDGEWRVVLRDVAGAGGPLHSYRLRVGPPEPSFRAAITPAQANIPSLGAAKMTLHVSRLEGFQGGLRLALDNPYFKISPDVVPADATKIEVEVTGPGMPTPEPIPLKLTATADVDGRTVVMPVTPCEDAMQAFLWRHLAPARTFLADVHRPPRKGGKGGRDEKSNTKQKP